MLYAVGESKLTNPLVNSAVAFYTETVERFRSGDGSHERREDRMLIVNDDQCLLAGVSSLSERCNYCSKPLTHYPLILSDDATQTVYHAACAIELATEIMVDVFTFFSPPAPYHPLYVLATPQAVSPMKPRRERERKEAMTHAVVNRCTSD